MEASLFELEAKKLNGETISLKEFEAKLEKMELIKKLHYDGINAGSFNVLFNAVKKITL